MAGDGEEGGAVKVTRPVLRWHGGKWMLAPWIIGHFPPHRVYTEVYGGAASVLLRKPRSRVEVYNDLDGEVVSLFRVLQDPVLADILTERLRLTPFARSEFERSYQAQETPVDRAWALIVRAFMGFGSDACTSGVMTGFRANSNQSSTAPACDWANYADALPEITERFRGVVVEQRPALDILAQHDSTDTLHYVDPPYVHSTRKLPRASAGLRGRYRFEMSDADHRQLAATLKKLGGGVVLSGYPSALYEDLYGDWHRVERPALADGARERTEVLWINEAAWSRSGRLF